MLSESAPAVCDPTTFGLDRTVTNKLLLHRLQKKPAIKVGVITLYDGTKFPAMKTGSTEGSVYAVYEDLLAVYIQYHQYKYPFLPFGTVTQIKLWRRERLPVTNVFSPNLFFNIMLPITGAVLSDKEQTLEGREFWTRRCREAHDYGCSVALVDFGSRTFQEFKPGRELSDALDSSWGGGMNVQAYQQKRWLIWKP